VKSRFVVPAFCALFFVSGLSFATEPRRYMHPGTQVTLEFSGFVFRATLPHGWSVTADQTIVPPPELTSSCSVRRRVRTEGDWDDFVVSALRSANGAHPPDGTRILVKVGGHQAVSNRYMREASTIRDIYIDLSDLRPDSGAV